MKVHAWRELIRAYFIVKVFADTATVNKQYKANN